MLAVHYSLPKRVNSSSPLTTLPSSFYFPIPAESETHCRESSDHLPTLFCFILLATTTSTALSSLSCCLGQIFPIGKIHCFPFLKFFLGSYLGAKKLVLKSHFVSCASKWV